MLAKSVDDAWGDFGPTVLMTVQTPNVVAALAVLAFAVT